MTKLKQYAESLIWTSDLHLDQASEAETRRFLSTLHNAEGDAILITGDISSSKHLNEHLLMLSRTTEKPIYFVPGNHDYYGSSIEKVDSITTVCNAQKNLTCLGNGEIVELNPTTALVGHRGWADGKAGAGVYSRVDDPDRYAIDDFRNLDREKYFRAKAHLGEESARYLRTILPLALCRYRHVIIATHVPPFTQSLRFNDAQCKWDMQPYYSNRSMGNLIVGMARKHPSRKITVLAGHTHSASDINLYNNISARVASSRRSKPCIYKTLSTLVENAFEPELVSSH